MDSNTTCSKQKVFTLAAMFYMIRKSIQELKPESTNDTNVDTVVFNSIVKQFDKK